MTDFNLGESILSLQTIQSGYDKFIIFLFYIRYISACLIVSWQA